MTTPDNNTPTSLDELIANLPKEMRGSPLTIGHFFDFMALLLKSHKALKLRVAQLEQQAKQGRAEHG
jgi:hypothetical protein